ncbi:PQQ-binding-like beta-propeller repeat protein [Streptomyces aidingensis]|uniref:PQQ-like domain-containing protein n=1 Tax=Streptomyces aidingensis TaxID=910347 RepID=A0A1I1KBZ3_9ACTN|nr:PQQ-binding-like beta-propeller repeat protein [Streptomyces aidingensis]SFC58474.1 PQQ-like domain-containing protein [Streptomyces aidingensis]
MAVIAVVIVVVLAAVGGGAWYLLGSGDEDEDTGGGTQAGVHADVSGGQVWSLDEQVAENVRPKGLWVVDDLVVKAGGSVLTAYSTADGSEVWTLDLGGNAVCAPATATADGLIVVGHGEQNCGQNITRIDLKTGEKGWSRPLEPEENPLQFQIAIAGSSYAIHTLGGWNLHRIEDGELIHGAAATYNALNQEINSIPFVQENEVEQGEEICAVDGVAGGAALIRRRTCATVVNTDPGTVTEPVFRLEEIDPDTGDTLWTLVLPDGRWLDKIHSTAPLVVSLRSEEFGPATELAFIEAGEITARAPIGDTGIPSEDVHLFREQLCRGDIVVYSPLDDCGGTAVHGDLLYISPSRFGGGTPVTAMNAVTGEVEWSFTTDEVFDQLVLAADEEGVLVYQEGYAEQPGAVVRISPDGKRAEPLFGTGDLFLPGSSWTAVHDGRLLLSVPDYSLEYDIAAYGPDGKRPAAGDPADEAAGEE